MVSRTDLKNNIIQIRDSFDTNKTYIYIYVCLDFLFLLRFSSFFNINVEMKYGMLIIIIIPYVLQYFVFILMI